MRESVKFITLVSSFILILGIMFYFENKQKQIKESRLYNVDLIIVNIGESKANLGKFHTPTHVKSFLCKADKYPNLYCELSNVNSRFINSSLYYNKKIGDTLHFDYINKNRFFIIK